MKKALKVFLILILTGFILSCFSYADEQKTSEGQKIIDGMKFKNIDFNFPSIGGEVEKYILPNGLTVLIMPDRRLPLINIDLIVKAGEVFEQKDIFGTASLCAEGLRSGGTKNYTADYIDKELDYKSINISFSSYSDYTGGGLNVLIKDFDQALRIFADMIMNPVFNEEKFKTDKMMFLDSIDRIEDNPGTLASVKFYNLVYGDHPYGWEYKKDAVEKITTDDLKKWHNKYFAPNNTIMAVSGDFDPLLLKEKLNEAFGDWERKQVLFPDIPEPVEAPRKECLIINKALAQSTVYAGDLGVRADTPDIMPLIVLDEIYGGGGFGSLLMYELREKRGLTYGVYSSFGYPLLYTGLFYTNLKTANKNTYKSIELILDIMEELKKSGVTEKKLKQTKEKYINSFVFTMAQPSSVLYRLMLLEFYNLPRDYYSNYISNIEKVTKEDILRCAQKYFHPEKIKIVIVGDAENIKDDMGKIAPVEVSDK
ncbi:MAG: pitrilysin family protein [Armatimonadota bacterium]